MKKLLFIAVLLLVTMGCVAQEYVCQIKGLDNKGNMLIFDAYSADNGAIFIAVQGEKVIFKEYVVNLDMKAGKFENDKTLSDICKFVHGCFIMVQEENGKWNFCTVKFLKFQGILSSEDFEFSTADKEKRIIEIIIKPCKQ